MADMVVDASGAGLDQAGSLGGNVGDGLVDAAGSFTDILVGPIAGTRAERAAADIIDGSVSEMGQEYDGWEKMAQDCAINAYDWHTCRRKDSDGKVACKMSHIADWETFVQEVRLLKHLQPLCDNFINIERVFTTGGHFCILTAEHSDCNMQSLVNQRAAEITTTASEVVDLSTVNDIASNAAFCVLAAVRQLHAAGYAHRDIKPSCFVAESAVPPHLRIWKLSDLSFTKQWGSCAKAVHSAQSRVSYLRSTSDPCSVGLVIYAVLCGRLPFSRLEASGDFQEYPAPEFECSAWEKSSPGAKEVITGLVSDDPEKRLSITQALRHVWVSKPRGYSLPQREPNDYTGMGYTEDGRALLDLIHQAYTKHTAWDTDQISRGDVIELLSSSVLMQQEGATMFGRHPLVRLIARGTLPEYTIRVRAIIDRSLDTIQGSRRNHVRFYDFLQLVGGAPWHRYLSHGATAGQDLLRHSRQSQSFVSRTERLLANLQKRIMGSPQLSLCRKQVEEKAAGKAAKKKKVTSTTSSLLPSFT